MIETTARADRDTGWSLYSSAASRRAKVPQSSGASSRIRSFSCLADFAAAFSGSFIGDTCFFLSGRQFRTWASLSASAKDQASTAHSNWCGTIRLPSSFSAATHTAFGWSAASPPPSSIPVLKFVFLNAISSAIWAALFCTVGYVFGLGAEQIVGAALHKHERLLIALGVGIAGIVVFGALAHVASRRGLWR